MARNKRNMQYFKQTSGRYNQYNKSTIDFNRPIGKKPIGKKPKPIVPQQPDSPTVHEYDGWWLNVNPDVLNMMCSPDGSSVWDMDTGQCVVN